MVKLGGGDFISGCTCITVDLPEPDGPTSATTCGPLRRQPTGPSDNHFGEAPSSLNNNAILLYNIEML
jgi:hypothetical protein